MRFLAQFARFTIAFCSLFASLLLGSIALGCAKTVPSPLINITGGTQEQISDPLAIGRTPTPPAKQASPSFIQDSATPARAMGGEDRDFIAILNGGGGVLTVWSSAPASWIWSHSAALSANFGDAFNWAMQPISDGFVRFVNKLTRNCLNVYGQGAIHHPCDEENPNQFFRILPMDNGAVAIQSASTNLCLQTSIHTKVNHPIVLEKCLQVPNSEQQWFLIPPFLAPKPILPSKTPPKTL